MGLMLGGGLREPSGIEEIDLVLARRDGETGILTLTSGEFTVTGADDTARHEVAAYLDAATLATWIEDGADGADGRFVDLLLEAFLEIPEDAREFSAGATSAIASFAFSQTKNHTFSVTLSETLDAADYQITAELLSPSDAGLVGEIVLPLSVAWTGSAYVVTAGEAVPKSESLSATDPADWDVVFSIQSVTGDAAGFDVAVRAVSSAVTPVDGNLRAEMYNAYEPSAGQLGSTSASTTILFKDSGNNAIGTAIAVPEDPSYWTNATLLSAIDAEIGSGEITAAAISAGGFDLTVPHDSLVAQVTVENVGGGYATTHSVVPGNPVYTNMSFKLTSIGLAMADTGTRFRSQRAPIRVFAPLA